MPSAHAEQASHSEGTLYVKWNSIRLLYVSILPATSHNASLYFSILLLPLMCNLFATGGHKVQQQPFYGPLSGTTRVSRYQKKHSPTHHPNHHPFFISFFHLPQSIASSLFKLRAWQSFCTTSLDVLFGLPLGLERSTSYSIHFFTQSVSTSGHKVGEQNFLSFPGFSTAIIILFQRLSQQYM